MATDRSIQAAARAGLFAVPAAAVLLLWPAVWNGFPIVFADTGTYLSQAIHHYAGWDRPVFYSLFMLPLHATITVWPVVVVQALLTAWLLWLVVQTLAPGVSTAAFVAGVALLAACTWLPWLVSELMPDLFTPLLVLTLCLLAWVPERLSPRRRIVLLMLAAFMIATQQSSLPLAFVLGVFLGILARWFAPSEPAAPSYPDRPDDLLSPSRQTLFPVQPRQRWLLIIVPPVLAALALCSVNLAAYGRFAVSPFGNIFLLARVIYDGPGMALLRLECPAEHWRLCPFIGRFPPTSDEFLWASESPLRQAGGPKMVSREAGAIIEAALLKDPMTEARATLFNILEQMSRFTSGDGLTPWPAEVSPWIEHDFSEREYATYASARQQQGRLSVPPWLSQIHTVTALSGVAACLFLLPAGFRRRGPCTGLLLAAMLTLPVSAAITGGLSAPHDRYQARIMWLPPFVAVLSLAALYRRPT